MFYYKSSRSSNSEVLNQLQNLKKHLYNEQIQIESELQNSVIIFIFFIFLTRKIGKNLF